MSACPGVALPKQRNRADLARRSGRNDRAFSENESGRIGGDMHHVMTVPDPATVLMSFGRLVEYRGFSAGIKPEVVPLGRRHVENTAKMGPKCEILLGGCDPCPVKFQQG